MAIRKRQSLSQPVQTRQGSAFSACPACGASVYTALMPFHISGCAAAASPERKFPTGGKAGGGGGSGRTERRAPAAAQESMDMGQWSESVGGGADFPETPMQEGQPRDALRARMAASVSPMPADEHCRKRLFQDWGQKFPAEAEADTEAEAGASTQCGATTPAEPLPNQPAVVDSVTDSQEEEISDAETVPFIGSVQDSQGRRSVGPLEEEDEVEESLPEKMVAAMGEKEDKVEEWVPGENQAESRGEEEDGVDESLAEDDERGSTVGEQPSRYDELVVGILEKSASIQQHRQEELEQCGSVIQGAVPSREAELEREVDALQQKVSAGLLREKELERAMGAKSEEYGEKIAAWLLREKELERALQAKSWECEEKVRAGLAREKELEQALQAKREECERMSRLEQLARDELGSAKVLLHNALEEVEALEEVGASRREVHKERFSEPRTPLQPKRSKSVEHLEDNLLSTQILSQPADIVEATQLLSSLQSSDLGKSGLVSRAATARSQDSAADEEFRRVVKSEPISNTETLGILSLAPENAQCRAYSNAGRRLFADEANGSPAQPKTPQTFAMLQNAAEGGLIIDFLDSFPPAQGTTTPDGNEDDSEEPGGNLHVFLEGPAPMDLQTTTEHEQNEQFLTSAPARRSSLESGPENLPNFEDEDEEDIPLSRFRKTKKRTTPLLIDSDSDVDKLDAGTDHEVHTTPSGRKRRRLVKLSESQPYSEANTLPDAEVEAAQDSRRNAPLRRSARLKKAIVTTSPLVERIPSGREEENGSEEESYESDGNSKEEDEDSFIDDDPESENSGEEISTGSADDEEYGSDGSERSRRYLKGEKQYRWKFEGELLSALAKDIGLCFRGLCALYRRQEEDEQIEVSSKYRNHRGFDKVHASRASTIAKFLLGDGDSSGPVVKTPAEVEAQLGKGAVTFCTDMCIRHSKQLFDIYESSEDPFFPGT